MKDLLANPYAARFLGALGAGLSAYAIPPHDIHAAVAAAISFFAYGVVHATATQAGES